MSITALTIVQNAFAEAKVQQAITSFSTTQAFPLNIALILLNQVIQDMNRQGRFWFCEKSQELPYSAGVYSWEVTTAYKIDVRNISRLRREATNYWGQLTELNYADFETLFREASMVTTTPLNWAKFNSTIYLDNTPDQDYTLTLYYYEDIPLIVNTTDTFPIPDQHLDVVQSGVYAYLCERLGKSNTPLAFQLYESKLAELLDRNKADTGLPQQWPAAF